MYNVFTDFHHAALLNSLILLFEKRLGGTVCRPIGKEWYEKGFWKVYDHPATVEQFLGFNGATPDGTAKLNEVKEKVDWGGKVLVDGSVENDGETYFCHDIDSGYTNRAITFESFMKAHIDIVIASLPQHIEPFKRLCGLHPNKPKLIYQIGNAWNIPEGVEVKNVMASANISYPPGLHYVQYHQEFNLDIFYPGFPREKGDEKYNPERNFIPSNYIYSFVNCFNIQSHFIQDWALFTKLETMMPTWYFRSFGGQCRDGTMDGAYKVADKMREAKFVWHTKYGGDGYGHVIHNVPAVGRPLIIKKQYYQGKLADDLLIDGVTCLTIDNLSPEQIVKKIEHYNDDYRYIQMCQKAYENFKRVVDFNAEEKLLRNFLANLL